MSSLLKASTQVRHARDPSAPGRFAVEMVRKTIHESRRRRLCYFILLCLATGCLMYGFSLYRRAVSQFEVRLGWDTRFRVGFNPAAVTAGNLKAMSKLHLRLEKGRLYHIDEIAQQHVRTYLQGLEPVAVLGGALEGLPGMAERLAPKKNALLHKTNQTVDIRFDFHVTAADPLGESVTAEFTCRKFSITVQARDGAGGGRGASPKIWQAMSDVVQGAKFMAKIARNGSVLHLGTSAIRSNVISKLHEMSALPLHMRTAFRVGVEFSQRGRLNEEQSADVGTLLGVWNNSLGAQFNGNKDVHVEGKLVVQPDRNGTLSGCSGWREPAILIRGNIVVVKRGGCQFLAKARQAQAAGAIGMVVVDIPNSRSLVYMGGEDPSVKLSGVIVPHDEGDDLIYKLQRYQNDVNIMGTIATGRHVFDTTEGVALQSHTLQASDIKIAPDFLGYDYLIEDQIKKRFSIFPPRAVRPGNFWSRTVRQEVPVPRIDHETYTMLGSVACPPSIASASLAGDPTLAAETNVGGLPPPPSRCLKLAVNTTETPLPPAEHDDPTQPGQTQDGAGDGRPPDKTMKLISAASEHGLTGNEVGEVIIDEHDGMIILGQLSQSLSGTRKNRFELFSATTRVEIQAESTLTSWWEPYDVHGRR